MNQPYDKYHQAYSPSIKQFPRLSRDFGHDYVLVLLFKPVLLLWPTEKEVVRPWTDVPPHQLLHYLCKSF